MLKSRLIYLGIILVSFIFSQALYESVSFMTFVIVLVLPIISVLIALAVYPLISVNFITTNTSVYRLDNFIIRFLMKGVSPFISPAVKITCHVPNENGTEIKKTVFAVTPGFSSRSYFDHAFRIVHRGQYTLKISSIEYYDFLKLVRIKKKIKKSIRINVLPRKIKLDIPVASEINNQENTFVLGENTVISGGDMVGVRDYVSGDNLKNVHWKLSSKSEDLVSKIFAEDICDRAFIIVDMCGYYEDIYKNRSMTDCVVETALCSIDEYCKSGVRFGVILAESKSSVKYFSVALPSDKMQVDYEVSNTSLLLNSDIMDLLNGVDFNMLSGSEVLVITSFKSSDVLKDIKKIFIDKKIKLNVVNITEEDTPDSAELITFSRDYLENRVRGTK